MTNHPPRPKLSPCAQTLTRDAWYYENRASIDVYIVTPIDGQRIVSNVRIPKAKLLKSLERMR